VYSCNIVRKITELPYMYVAIVSPLQCIDTVEKDLHAVVYELFAIRCPVTPKHAAINS
jgi:hypothetical protein